MKVGALVLRRERGGFDQEWGREIEKKAENVLTSSDYDVFFSKKHIVDDKSLRSALDECRDEDVNTLLVLQPTMSDGKLASVLAQQWDLPVVFWATPEKPESVSSNSLVGNHIFMSAFRQFGHPFEFVYGMPGENETNKQINSSVKIVNTVDRLQNSRLDLIGYHAPGFIDMSMDPYLLSQSLGAQMSYTSLPQFTSLMKSISDEYIKEDIDKIHNLPVEIDNVSGDVLSMSSRFHLSFRRHIDDQNLDGLAIRDWSELSGRFEFWPYLSISRLLSEDVPVAMEGDVDGALSCLIGSSLGCGPVYISDWLEHTDDTVALWHTGNAPFQLSKSMGSDGGARVAKHFNNQNPAVVDADLRPNMPITVYRFWHCDNEYKFASFEAETIDPPKQLKGTNGFARVDDLSINSLFRSLCMEGMPHHVSVVEGHHSELLKRLADQLDLSVVSV